METIRDSRPETVGGLNVSPWSLVPRPIEPPMSHDSPVVRCQVEIINPLGLHMRPADKFVRLALQFESEVRVIHHGHEYNGKSILDLTSLAAECGTLLEVEARGLDAERAIEALSELVQAKFHETDEGAQEPAP